MLFICVKHGLHLKNYVLLLCYHAMQFAMFLFIWLQNVTHLLHTFAKIRGLSDFPELHPPILARPSPLNSTGSSIPQTLCLDSLIVGLRSAAEQDAKDVRGMGTLYPLLSRPGDLKDRGKLPSRVRLKPRPKNDFNAF